MNEITLTDNEQNELEKLTKDAQRNTTEAQRFAIEAAKVLSVTQERLKDYKDRGFFKRCWYAVSGKTSELARANQTDLIKMQKFAWMYLAKLQEQNLIQARAIAVIRNNLKELQGEIAELSDQISVIVDKFDARLTDLEGTSALHDWLLHIKLNDSIDRNTKYICFLQIVFDCLSVMRKGHIGFEKANMRDDIDAALVEFGIDRDEVMTVDAFVSGLYDEVAKVGMERLKSIINISVDGEVLPASYMLQNFTGTGCNALYGFENEMERNENVAMQIEDENARNAIRLAAVKAVMTNGSAQFTFSELGREIVGACLIAEDLYRSEHGMDMGDMLGLNEPAADDGFDIGSILGNCAEIKRHSFLDDNPSEDEKRSYIESFALVFAAMGEFRDSEYLTALAKLFGCEESVECVKNVSAALRSNPRSINGQVRNDLKVMNDDKRKYSWALDAFMMGCVDGEVHAKVKSGVKTVLSKAFRLPESGVEDYLSGVETLVTQKDAEAVKEAIAHIDGKTDNWTAIASFKGLEIEGQVADKALVSSSDGNSEVVGLAFKKLMKVPFLTSEVYGVESFKGRWYVVCDNGQIWSSDTAEKWVQVKLPASDLEGYTKRLKVVNDALICWSDNADTFCYTEDGVEWKCSELPSGGDHRDFFYFNGKFYHHLKRRESFTYIGVFIFEKTGYKDVSVFYCADNLWGPWELDDSHGSLKDGHCIDDGGIYGLKNGLVGVARFSLEYRLAYDYSYDDCQINYALDGSKWQRANIEGEFNFSDPRGPQSMGFLEVEDGLVLSGTCGVLFSMSGSSWRRVIENGLNGAIQKVGNFYCGFKETYKWDSKGGVFYFSKDAVDFKELPISQRPCKTCFCGDKLFLVDENEEQGGFFLGQLQVKQV